MSLTQDELYKFITIVVPTNFVVSCPSTKLVKTVLDDLFQKFPFLQRCRVVISYDLKESGDGLVYKNNLCKLSLSYPNACVVTSVGGQRKSFINGVNSVETPLLLLLEHDWIFERVEFDWSSIASAMLMYPFVNHIKFNQRQNCVKNTDKFLLYEERVKEVPLLATPSVSNNPNLSKLRYWKDLVFPILSADVCALTTDDLGYQVEIPLMEYHKTVLKSRGMRGHIGTYIYGRLGDLAIVKHLDGKTFT